MPRQVNLPKDFFDLLAELASADARYLIIGGYAVGYHDRPRTTKDLDLLVDSSAANVERVCSALRAFGAPEFIIGELMHAANDEIVWMGAPPLRVDLLKAAPGVIFDEAYSRRVTETWEGVRVEIIGIDDLISAKRAAGRDRDLLDVRHLERVRAQFLGRK
jgi:predicted nucleotidyltransferase